MLLPQAMWSLSDVDGNYCPPTPNTLRLLRLAMYHHHRQDGHVMEKQMENSVLAMKQACEDDSRKHLHASATDFCRHVFKGRQWSNRIFLNAAIPTPAKKSGESG